MSVIILEGVLFLALLGVATTIVVYVVRHYTAAGRVIDQTRNRKQIEQAVNLTCDIHGRHEEREMVRLESGETMCPQCYRAAIAGEM